MTSYVESSKSRIKPLLEIKKEMSEDDMEKFGKKDAEAYPFIMTIRTFMCMLCMMHLLHYVDVGNITRF